MAEFLTTTGISYRLNEIIKAANERLVIISPFIRINPRIKDLLEDRDRMKIDIRVVYGKNELHPEENKWLESMTSIRTSFCKNLHAKCYLNEKEALLTSMNLYEFSQSNNDEMGILVSKKDDERLYDQILEESQRLVRTSEEIRVTAARIEANENVKVDSRAQAAGTKPQPALTIPKNGFCIRCKAVIPANPERPYCNNPCYASWKLDFTQKLKEATDAITLGRRHLWLASEGFSLSAANADVQELPATLYHLVATSLVYAA